MTPLARRIMKHLMTSRKARTISHEQARALRTLMSDMHYFDMTEVRELTDTLGEELLYGERDAGHMKASTLAFLPAEKTWLEVRAGAFGEGVIAVGIAIVRQSDELAKCLFFEERKADIQPFPSFHIAEGYPLPLRSDHPSWNFATDMNDWNVGLPLSMRESKTSTAFEELPEGVRGAIATQYRIYAMLACVNSPKVIGRKTHAPNHTMSRKLATMFGVGKFPLRGWTEIILKVAPPKISDGANDTHLTGQRALHFVRSFIRIRLGKLEYVTEHWRGDPALGIKQSRYRVTD